MMEFKGFLGWLLGVASGILELLNWKHRKQAAADAAKPAQEAQEAVEEVYEGDADAVNARLDHLLHGTPREDGKDA